MVGGHVVYSLPRRAYVLGLAFLMVAFGLIANAPVAQAVIPTSVKTFQGHFGTYNASTSFMTAACSVSTSSTIVLPAAPAGATIDAAYLVWAASGNTTDTTATVNGTAVTGVAVQDFLDPTEGYYQTRADITSLVSAAGGSYTITNITAATGAPWCTFATVMKSATIYVFYEDVTLPVVQLNFYSGLEIVYGSEITVNVSHLPLAASALGAIEVLLFEGDSGLSSTRNGFRERFRVNRTIVSSGDNQWNSSTAVAIDMDLMAIPSRALSAGATSTQLRMSSGNDFVLLSSFVLTSAIQAADIEIAKSVDNATPDPGDTVTFTVTASNIGVSTSTSVQVTDAIPGGLTFVSASTTQGTYSSGTGIWDVGTLTSGVTETLTIVATVDAGTVGNTIVNTATKTGGSGFDVDPANDIATATLTVRGADLAVTKSVDIATPNPGDTINYSVTVTNNGPTDTTGVTVADALPAGLTFVSVSATSGSYAGSTWTIGPLSASASTTLTITATVDAGTAGSDIVNTASISSNDLVDPVAGNNSANVQIRVPLVDVAVTKATSNATPLPGDTFTYTVTATNGGPDAATGVAVDDVIPASITLTGVSATAGSYASDTWTIGILASGVTETITFTVAVPTNSTGGNIVNTASVSSVNETESTTANNSASISIDIAQSDISVTKSVDISAPNPGDSITYTITVTNNGPDAATGVTVGDALPAGVTATSSSATQGSYTDPTWVVGALAIGASATLTIDATVDAGTAGSTVTNSAVGSADQADTDASNDAANVDIDIPAIDLALVKTVDNNSPNPGETITYTVTLTNNGPDTATNVAIADTVPSGVTIVTASPSQGTYGGGVWTVGTISNGGVETLTIVATVDGGTAGSTIVNTASVSSVSETDTDPTNDSANASIGVPAVDLVVTKTVSAPNLKPAQTVTYTVTVTNNGPDGATGITLTDNLPTGVTLTSSSATQGSFSGGIWNIGSLANGAGAVLTLTTTINAGAVGTTVTNVATLSNVTETDIDSSNDSDTAAFTVPAVDLAVTKTVSNAAPNPGDTVTYTITITNSGPDGANGVGVFDALPSQVSLVSSSATQGSYTGSTWSVGALVPGASATLTIVVTVLSSAVGMTITNIATMTVSDEPDTDPSNNSANVSFSTPAIDLEVTKTSDVTSANPGDTVTYTILLANHGPDSATVVSLTDALPAGLTLVSATTTTGAYVAPTWTVGTLASGASETLTIVATVNAGTAGTTLTNTAAVAGSTETDVDPSNDSDPAAVAIPSADLAITKTVDIANPLPGDTVSYTVTVTNNGPSAATGVTVSDSLPIGVTFVSATPSQGSYVGSTWTIGGLGNGASATLTIVATVDAGTAGASILNTASISTLNETDLDSSNDSATAAIYVSAVDLAVTKTASTVLAQPGDTISYTVVVTNNGPDTASGVTIDDSVPSGVTFVTASSSQGSYTAGVWTVGVLTNGQTETLTITVTVNTNAAGTTVTNTASVGSVVETDTGPFNDTASAAFGVPAVDISVVKVVDNATPVPGATITYTVTVGNAGPSPASGLSITDALPTGVTLVSATLSQGTYVGSTWTIGTLSIGGSVTLVIVATVDAGTAGTTITNTAAVTSVDQYDLDVTNDTDSAAIVVSAVDLDVTKTVDDPSPNPGETITYTVTISNAGPEIATGVSLTDTLPTGVTLVSATPSQGAVVGATWTVGSLAVAASATLAIVATVDTGTAGSTISNTAAVASVDQIDVDPSNDSDTADITVPLVDIALSKTIDDATPNPGDTITYTVTANNTSADTATGVTVADTLPAGVTLTGVATSQGSYVGSTWTIGTIGSGATATLTITATVDAGTAGSTITNTASVTNVNETESDITNNSSSVGLTVNAVDLSVAKTVSDPAPNPGDTITYVVTVSNGGPNSTTGVAITDALPAGVTLVSSSTTSGSYVGSTWTVGTIASGSSATLTIVVTVDAGTAGSTITNTASVGSVTETDTDNSNDSDSAALSVPSIDLAVTKTVDEATPNEGDTVTFTVTIVNNGPDAATGVAIADSLPAGFTMTSSAATVGTYSGGSWSLGSIANGTTETLTIVGTIDTGTAGSTVTNTASVATSNETDSNSANDSNSASVTVNAIDLAVTKTVDISAPNPGDTIIYTVMITNAGPNTATGVSIADTLPAGVTLVSSSTTQGTYSGSTWTVGTVANGATAVLTITATVDLGTAGWTITNAASVAGVTEADTDASNDSNSAAIFVQLVDVAVAKTVDTPAPNPGDTITYTVTVTNGGPDTATGVDVTDTLPAGVTLVSSSTTQGTYATSVWTVGTLASGASATLTIAATVRAGTEGSTITNTATITDVTETDSNLLNNSASVDITVRAVDLAVTKTVSDPAPNPGDTITYTVTIANSGPDAATSVSVSDALPSGLTLVGTSATQGTYSGSTWTLGTVASGATAVLTITATVDLGTAGSTITNTASVASVTETDTDATNDSDSISLAVPAIDLDVVKTVDNATPNEGDTVSYTIAVTNNGPNAATGVELTDILPVGVTLVSTSATAGSVSGTVWSVGPLANGATETLTIVVTVDVATAGSILVNTATVTAVNETDTDGSNDSDSASIAVLGVNLIVSKSVNDTTPNPGDTITYTIQITNGGPDTATGVALTDSLPTGITLVSSTASQGTYTAPLWSVGSIPNGTTATLSIVTAVNAGTEGSAIVNTGTVSAVNETDTNPSNDSDSVTINVPAVDVSITKSVDVPTANPGDTVTFTVTASNAGPDTATGVVVADVLPSGLSLTSSTPSLGSVVGATWTIGALSKGAAATLVIVATVDSGTAGSTITNTASISGVNEVDTDTTNDSDTASVTINAVNLAVAKSVNNPTPNPGDTITYTVDVTNAGPDLATDVALTDTLPSGLTSVSVSTTTGVFAGSTWTIGGIASGASETLTIVATVDAGTAGLTITNTASITTVNETDTDATNDSDTATFTVPTIDLIVTKSVDNGTPIVGDTVTYTIGVTNSGPSSATAVEVTETLPIGVTLVSTSTTQGTVSGTVWSIGALANGASATLTIVITVDTGTAGVTLVNTAGISGSNETDTDPTNDSDGATIVVQAVDIAVTKTADTSTARVGDTVTFTITAANSGPDTATGVAISDLLPAGLTYTSGSPSQGGYVAATGIWTVGTVASGASAVFTMTATIDPGTPGTTLTNTATLSAVTETDTDSANNIASASVSIPAIDIAVVKTVDAATTNPGDALTYTITLTNSGPDTATGVEITDVLPSGVTLVSTSTTQGSLSGSVWVVGTLSAAGTATLTYNVTVNAGTAGSTITNTAALTDVDQDDTDASNNSSTAATSVNAVDLALTKVADTATSNEGSTVVYTVTVTNDGPDTATGIEVTDALPAGVSIASASPSQGTYVGSTWAVGSLGNGASATLTISVTVDSGTAGSTITNNAAVSGVNETDTDGSNDTDSAAFDVQAIDVAVSKTVDLPIADEGDTVTFTIQATNTGPDAATGVTISDSLPAGFTLTSATVTVGSYSAGIWDVGPLAVSGTETLTVTGTIDTGAAGSTISNTAAFVSADQTDTDAANDSASANVSVNAVDVAVTKTVNSASPLEGDFVTFSIELTNNGPNTATGVEITDALPSGLTMLTSTPSQGSIVGSVWSVGTVSTGTTATWTIVASVDAGTAGSTITNTATLTGVVETDTNSANDAASASVSVPLVDLAVSKTADLATANPGDTLTYTVTVSNGGPDTATGVAIDDALPAGVTLVVSAATQGTFSGTTWTVGALTSGATETLTITVTVDVGTAGSIITNTAGVSSVDETDSDPSNDSGSATTTINAVDLSVAKIVSDTTPNPGDAILYTVTVTNSGPDTATGIEIADALPAGVALNSSTVSQGTYAGATWTVGALASGASATLTISVAVSTGTEGTSVTNTATVTSVTETDTDSSNDVGAVTFSVPAIDLAVTKTVDNAGPNPGDAVTYTVTIINNGPSAATGVAVGDSLPAGLTFVSSSQSQGVYIAPTWTVGTIANGASETLTLIATVDAGTAGATITNTAAVTGSNEVDTDPSNDSASVDVDVPAVNLIVSKSVNDTTPNPGETITYTVQVTNGGPDTATGVTLSDSPPAGVSLVSTTTSQGSYATSLWTVGSLSSGVTATLTLIATVATGTEGTAITNTAAVSTVNETETNPSNDADSVTINVPAVDVSITKTVDVPTANPGDTVTFTITASNAGPDTATGVEVTDALPAGLTLVSVTPSSGSVVGSTWSVGSVVAGTNEILVIVTVVDAATADSTITNSASVTGTNETDTTPGNDSDSASVTIAAVDIALIKTIDNNAPNVGDTVTYTVTATNNGPDAATGVSISESLPGGATLVSTATSQGSVSGSLWSVGTLNSGASATLTIVATVASGTGGTTVTNAVTVASVAEEDTDLSNDSASASFTTQSADLDIDKVVDIANVAPGDTVTFTVTIANNGPDSAINIVVDDVLPAGLTAVSATASLGTWTAPQWTIPTLGSGTSATLVMVATVDAGLWNQTFVNTANVTATDQEDPDPTNNSDSAIVTTALSADLAVTKNVDDATPDAGETVVFTITVTNIGPDDDPTVTVTDTLPAGLTFFSAAASTGNFDSLSGVWTVGTLPSGTTEALTISALVDPGFGATVITNLVTVSGSLVDTEPANDQASADVTPTLVDVSIVKTAPGTATAGATISYSIIVSNSGPDTVTGVTVTDVLPGDVTYIGSAASLGTYNATNGVWTVGILNNAATATLTINVSVNSDTTGDVVNTATVSVTGPEDDTPANDTSIASTRVMVPPVATNDTVATPYETSVVITVTANDTDADGTIDLTTVLVTAAPANGTVTVDPVTGDLTYVPNAGFSGADIFEYRVCDNDGLCDTASVFVTIDPQNDAPFPYVRNPDGDPQPVGVLSYTIEVGDTPDPLPLIDPNDDNIIVLEIVDGSLPPGLSINPDGTFSGVATTVGTYTMQVQICDDGTPQRCSLFSVIIHVGETLPFTGIEVLNFVRIGLLFVLGGATLLAFQRKRDDEESRDNNAPTVS